MRPRVPPGGGNRGGRGGKPGITDTALGNRPIARTAGGTLTGAGPSGVGPTGTDPRLRQSGWVPSPSRLDVSYTRYMQRTVVQWSALACPLRGAGGYLGVSPWVEQERVALSLSARRGVVYDGGKARVRAAAPWPVRYFAIRDPSLIRVIPLDHRGPGPDDRHVTLMVKLNGNGTHDADGVPRAAIPLAPPNDPEQMGVFMMTVGLRPELEAAFCRHAAHAAAGHNWQELCALMRHAGEELSA
jgi:hypothetical protein